MIKEILTRMTLVQKGIIAGSIVLLVNSIMFIYSFARIQEDYQIASLEAEGSSAVRSISEVARFGLMTQNEELLRGQTGGFLSEHLERVILLDRNGGIVSNVGLKGGSAVPLLAEAMKKGSDSRDGIREDIRSANGTMDYIVMTGVIETPLPFKREELLLGGGGTGGKERLGTAVVVLNAGQVYAEISRNRTSLLLLGALSIAVGIPLIALIVKYLASPLKQLVTATEEVARGNMDHTVDIKSRDEIGRMADSFNRMISGLAETRGRLIVSERLAAAGRLASSMSHEINNPLAIIKNYLYILGKKRMKEDDPNREVVQVIDREVERIARIISDFSDFYKGTAVELPLEPVDVSRLLSEALDRMRNDLAVKGINIGMDISAGCAATSNGEKLLQALDRLFKNAEESMPEGGSLNISCRAEDRHIHISISDTGHGIPQERLTNIFDPFFSTREVKGVGLGLPVAYGIVRNLKGDIDVRSEEGKGTIFTISIPAVIK